MGCHRRGGLGRPWTAVRLLRPPSGLPCPQSFLGRQEDKTKQEIGQPRCPPGAKLGAVTISVQTHRHITRLSIAIPRIRSHSRHQLVAKLLNGLLLRVEVRHLLPGHFIGSRGLGSTGGRCPRRHLGLQGPIRRPRRIGWPRRRRPLLAAGLRNDPAIRAASMISWVIPRARRVGGPEKEGCSLIRCLGLSVHGCFCQGGPNSSK